MPARPPETDEAQHLTQRLLWMLVLPSGLCLTGFALLTDPTIWRFSTHYFADRNDGLLSVWRIGWVREALFRSWETTRLDTTVCGI
jgi:hypothetical protein